MQIEKILSTYNALLTDGFPHAAVVTLLQSVESKPLLTVTKRKPAPAVAKPRTGTWATRILSALGKGPLTASDVFKAIVPPGQKTGACQTCLARLKATGEIVRDAGTRRYALPSEAGREAPFPSTK